MKRYKDYMDGVEVSDTLHEKLKHLEPPQKRPAAWKKYGAAAAALVLVAGVGAYGLSRGGWGALMENFKPAAEVKPEIADIPAPFPMPDIANEDDPHAPSNSTNKGYELINGGFVTYYVLPDLKWADASQGMEMDYALAPLNAISRDAAWNDALMFSGGEKAMADHLLWDGRDWGGCLWFEEDFVPDYDPTYEDGVPEDVVPCAACFYTNWVDGTHLYLEVIKGSEVPSCVVLPDEYYETSQWQGVKITALKNGGYMVTDDGVELRERREVSFFCGGVGYKLTLYAADADRADELCARFVRYAVAGGFQLDALSADGVVDHSGFSVGEPNWEDDIPDKGIPPEDVPTANILHPGDPGYIEPFPAPGGVPEADSGLEDFYCDCPYCADGTVHTHPYDPSAHN